ncbi:hypothetical protein [Clavibacter zhangzhiyongii]|uniref:hypothetical protein n=1 Tax=Clavibacter zhangzhiyongii TaxID=2768071 RepID=UPI0039E1001C
MNAHTLAPWLELLKDFLIPVAAILIPTVIAVWLAKRERLAADAARADDRRLDVQAREEEFRVAAAARAEDRRLDTEAREEERSIAAEVRAEDRRLDLERRAEDRRLAEERVSEEVRQKGGVAALEAMEDLMKAATEQDTSRRREHMMRARADGIPMFVYLQSDHPAVAAWAFKDLSAITPGANNPGPDGISIQFEEVMTRYTAFGTAITAWMLGDTDDEWFRSRTPEPLQSPPTGPATG